MHLSSVSASKHHAFLTKVPHTISTPRHQRGKWSCKVSRTISSLAFFSLSSEAGPTRGTHASVPNIILSSHISALQRGALWLLPREVEVTSARRESRPWSPSFFTAWGSFSLWINLLLGALNSAAMRLCDGV